MPVEESTSAKWQRRLLIGPHYAMERFGVLCLCCILMFSVLGVWLGMHQVKRHSDTFASQVLYDSSFAGSRSGLTGSAVAAFSNEARDKVAVLVHFDNALNISSDASDYFLRYAGRDEDNHPETLQSSPTGNIYVYGQSGYMVVTFDNGGTAFPCQILYCALVNGHIIGGEQVNEDAETLAEAFDLMPFSFNPGASGVYQTSAFDSGAFDAETFYRDTLLASRERDIRKTLDADLVALNQAMAYVEEYRGRLERDGVNVDEHIPEWYAGDKMAVSADGDLSLITSTVTPGGFDVDWRGGSISSGYLEQLMRGTGAESTQTFMAEHIALQGKLEYVTGTWHMVDGTDFEEAARINPSATMSEIRDNIDAFETMLASYAAVKTAYQTTDITALLQLEIEAQAKSTNYTSAEGVVAPVN